jgi:peroxin-2
MQDMGGRTGLEGEGLSLTQRTLYGLGVVVLRYVWSRTDELAANQHWGDSPHRSWQRVLWRSMRWAENAFKVASLLNFLLFLRFGRYRQAASPFELRMCMKTSSNRHFCIGHAHAIMLAWYVLLLLCWPLYLVRASVRGSHGNAKWMPMLHRSVLERLLGARLVYSRASMARALSFEYLNRQLVWHELSELLLFMLPLINVARVKSFVMSHLPRMSGPSPLSLSSGKRPLASLLPSTCFCSAGTVSMHDALCSYMPAADWLHTALCEPCRG